WVDSSAEVARAGVPDADLAPVAGIRHVDHADVAFDLAAPRPVGVGDQHFARRDDLADHRDMADAHVGIGFQHHDGARLRQLAAVVAILRLRPPGAGIAANVDAGNGAGE